MLGKHPAPTMTQKLLSLLKEGPGTSGELAAELEVGQRTCAANLHRLWHEGRIDRDTDLMKSSGRGAPAHVYGVLGAFKIPSERPPPRPKRIREYKYRDRRAYDRQRWKKRSGRRTNHV